MTLSSNACRSTPAKMPWCRRKSSSARLDRSASVANMKPRRYDHERPVKISFSGIRYTTLFLWISPIR